MDKVDRDALKAFLHANCANDALARKTFALLLPLIKVTEGEGYPLAAAIDIDKAALIRAIGSATACICKDVKFIPSGQINDIGLDEWTEDVDYVNTIKESLFSYRSDVFKKGGRLGKERAALLIEMLDKTFFGGLNKRLIASHADLANVLDRELYRSVMAVPDLIAAYLIAYAMLGDESNVDAIGLLAARLPKAIPIGEPWNELGTWYVLTA